MAQTRFYPNSAIYAESLGRYLSKKYSGRKYQVQLIEVSSAQENGYIFQVKRKYAGNLGRILYKISGLDLAGTVKIQVHQNDLNVEAGGGRWIDKAAVAGFAAFIAFGVLIIPAGWGAFKQKKLITDLINNVDNYFKEKSTSDFTQDSSDNNLCNSCRSRIKPGMVYCGNCGVKL